MAEEHVETLYGKYYKYEIFKKITTFGSAKFYIYRDGKYYKGPYSSLSGAVEAAKRED